MALNNEVNDIVLKIFLNGKDSSNISSYNDALKKLDKAIALDSQYHISYLNKANIYKKLGHYDETIIEYKNAIKYDRKNPQLYIIQGHTYEKIGKLDSADNNYFKAIKLYDGLIKEFPDSIDLMTNRAFVFLFTHDKEEALTQVNDIKSKSDTDKQKIDRTINLINNLQKENFTKYL